MNSTSQINSNLLYHLIQCRNSINHFLVTEYNYPDYSVNPYFNPYTPYQPRNMVPPRTRIPTYRNSRRTLESLIQAIEHLDNISGRSHNRFTTPNSSAIPVRRTNTENRNTNNLNTTRTGDNRREEANNIDTSPYSVPNNNSTSNYNYNTPAYSNSYSFLYPEVNVNNDANTNNLNNLNNVANTNNLNNLNNLNNVANTNNLNNLNNDANQEQNIVAGNNNENVAFQNFSTQLLNQINSHLNSSNSNEPIRINSRNTNDSNITEQIRDRIRQALPELVEITLYSDGRPVTNIDTSPDNFEDVPIRTNLETLRENTTIDLYENIDTDYDKCSICRENFEGRDIVRKINSCNHIFHINCLDTWLETHTSCPVCRADLRESETPIDPDLID